MKEINSKSSLAIVLSKLKGFEKQKLSEEQYPTEPEIAAEMLWLMFLRREIEGKVIADLGSGTGILGFGALLLGAKKVFLVEKDNDAMDIAKQNHEMLKNEDFDVDMAEFILSDVNEFNEKVDVVVENPPFGTKEEHADKAFLEKAFSIAPMVYSFHKTSTEKFISAISKDNGFKVAEKIDIKFPLKKAHSFHTRKIFRIDVTLYRLEKA